MSISLVTSTRAASNASLVCPSGCQIFAASTTTTIVPTTISSAGVLSRSTSDVYLVFSTYEVGSFSSNNGTCINGQGLPKTLLSPYSATSQPVENTTAVFIAAQSSLVSYLGLTGCTPPGGVPPTKLVSVQPITGTSSSGTGQAVIIQPSPPSSTLIASTSTPSPPTNQKSRGLDARQRWIVSATISVSFLASVILTILLGRRFRQRKRAATAAAATSSELNQGLPSSSDNTQPYLEQKAELDAEEARKHELEAQQRVFEMVGEDSIREMPTGQERRRTSALQELRGAEHSKELEVPNNFREKAMFTLHE